MWVGCFFAGDFSLAFSRVEEALRLIKAYDPLRYGHIVRDVDRVWVSLLPGSFGQFRKDLKLCVLDERFVLADTTRPEQIAAAIVHEATHARLIRCGIGYETELRGRVEAICFRRERAFAAKLPNGELARGDAERRLPGYEASRSRIEQGKADALRYLGVPEFLIRPALGSRRLLRRMKRLARRAKDL